MKRFFKKWISICVKKYFPDLLPKKEVIVEKIIQVVPDEFSQDKGHLILTNILRIMKHYQYNNAEFKIEKIINIKTVSINLNFDKHQSYKISVSYKDIPNQEDEYHVRGLDSKKMFITFGKDFDGDLKKMNQDLEELFWQRIRGFQNEIRFNRILTKFLRSKGLQSSFQLIFNKMLNVNGVDVALLYKRRVGNLYINFQVKSSKKDLKQGVFYKGVPVHFILVNDNVSDIEIINNIRNIINSFIIKNKLKK